MPKMIVSNVLIDDLLNEANPDLEGQPEVYTRALRAMLRPAINQVIKAYKTPVDLPRVAAQQAAKMAVAKTTYAAFKLFIANLTESDDESLDCYQ